MAANAIEPTGSTWAIRLSTLLWALLALCFLAGVPVLLGATWLSLPALWLLAALLALPLVWLWRRVWRPSRARRWWGTWLRGSTGLWFLLCGLAAAPVYWLAIATETRPAIVPTVTLSNGARTVVLQGMQHVGSERFFQAVVYDLEKALAEGYAETRHLDPSMIPVFTLMRCCASVGWTMPRLAPDDPIHRSHIARAVMCARRVMD